MAKHSAVCFGLPLCMPLFFSSPPPNETPNCTDTGTSCSIVPINGDVMTLLLFHMKLGQLGLNLKCMKMILRIFIGTLEARKP